MTEEFKYSGESPLAPIYDQLIRYMNVVKAMVEFNKKWGFPHWEEDD